jgi:hypothetical protein
MRRRDYLIFGDIEGKLDVLRVECTASLRGSKRKKAPPSDGAE